MLILLNLVEDDKLHKKAVKLGVIATSIHQLEVGSSLGKEAAAWILCHLIKHVTEEQRVETAVPLADMIRGNQWSTKSASCKVSSYKVCVAFWIFTHGSPSSLNARLRQ